MLTVVVSVMVLSNVAILFYQSTMATKIGIRSLYRYQKCRTQVKKNYKTNKVNWKNGNTKNKIEQRRQRYNSDDEEDPEDISVVLTTHEEINTI